MGDVSVEGTEAVVHGFLNIGDFLLLQQVEYLGAGVGVVQIQPEGAGGVNAHCFMDGGVCRTDPLSDSVVEVIGEVHWESVEPCEAMVSEFSCALSVGGEFSRVVWPF